MYTVRKEFKFEAAHVLDTCYSNECKRIHGHSYRVEVFITSNDLNADSMVVDFKMLKEIVSPLIDAWDHRLIGKRENFDTWLSHFEHVVLVDFNPTAENMCKFLHNTIKFKLFGLSIFVGVKVRVWETATSYAEYSD